MTYRLLAFDYDGTVAVDGALPGERIRAAVAEVQARGVRVVLATGRSYCSAVVYAEALGLRDPIVCAQGAVVRELTGARSTLLTVPVPDGPLGELLDLATDRGLDVNLYSDADEMFYVTRCCDQAFYDRWFGLPMRHAGSYREAQQLIAAEGKQAIKALIIGEARDNERLTAELADRFAGRLDIMRSHPLFVEATAPGVSKGSALAFLAQRFGIAQHEVMAAGDSGNDLSMVRWAGLGVAMDNATPDVKAAAGWIAPHVKKDGLVTAIERFILSNGRSIG